MPREKQFDVAAALCAAMETFWAHGFEHTSMEQLLARMGIQRGSFYDTFGSKREVLLAALANYDVSVRRAALVNAAAGKPPVEGILAVFRALLDGPTGATADNGCLLVNCGLELAARDEAVAAIVRAGLEDTRSFFEALVEAGQRDGSIRAHPPAPLMASILGNQLVALMVHVRTKAGHTEQRSVLAGVAHLLGRVG